jgi:outer membrane protein insertion porin family
MSFFDPQQIGQDIQPNQSDNTVDINWKLVEKGSSQVQLQAGYGGNSFIGTLGLTFNNFSLRNFLKFKDFRPVPQETGRRSLSRFRQDSISRTMECHLQNLGCSEQNQQHFL